MRTILVGTTETLGPLARQLAAMDEPVEVLGAVVAELPTSGVPRLDPKGKPCLDHEHGLAETPKPLQPNEFRIAETPIDLEKYGSLTLLGGLSDLNDICRHCRVERAIVSLPAGMDSMHEAVRAELRRLGVVERVVPPLVEMLANEPAQRSECVTPRQPLDLAALIGRTPHAIDRELVAQTITNKTVLVTGAGGSIGSELVRICASFNPAKVILIERAENALFEVDRQLGARFPNIAREALLHDVVDAERTMAHFVRTRPDVVFHAAAHKHVPLMEDHPAHAVNNNLFGTASVARASAEVGAERFVLISTDKAVHPSSVMGATKRMAEHFVRSMAARRDHSTRISMVRFGNVLGSNGSVLTIWADQIARGGAISVTDARMTRYFMTIPEAASLVIQAGAMSGSGGAVGEVFVLDMGEPVRIVDLAERFVRAHGFEPVNEESNEPRPSGSVPTVPIRITGIRPGEKIHEQLAYRNETLAPTAHPAVRRFSDAGTSAVCSETMMAQMGAVRSSRSAGEVLAAIGRFVPELAERHAPATEPKLVPAPQATTEAA